MGVFLNLLGMPWKTTLLLMMIGIVVQLHNPGVAGLPSAYSEEHLPILYSEEPWYKNNHPAHPALGQLVTGYLIPGHWFRNTKFFQVVFELGYTVLDLIPRQASVFICVTILDSQPLSLRHHGITRGQGNDGHQGQSCDNPDHVGD